LWDAHAAWPDIEPQKGKWVFDKLDTYLSLAQQHHVQVLLPLGMSPKWASARPAEKSAYQPGFAAEPVNLSDWADYVRAVVGHCKGRVQAYEIWNEPNLNVFWTGHTEQMVDLTHQAHDIIKSIDPNALVISPSATASNHGDAWLNEFLEKGGGRYVDVIGYHFYTTSPEAMVPLITQIRQIMAQNNAGSLPLWNTETGWAKPKPFPSDDLGAAYLARAYLLDWAAGVSRFFWYAWDNHSFVSVETTKSDNQTPTSAGRAFETIQSWLVGAQMRSCDMAADHTWTCMLHRGNLDEWVVWNPDHGTQMKVPPAWRATTITPLNSRPAPLSTATLNVNEIPQLIIGGQTQ
jgi:GH35 family endo-1,4-beta-xylanase